MNRELLSLLNSNQRKIDNLKDYPDVTAKMNEIQTVILESMLREVKTDDLGLTYQEQAEARKPNGKIPAIKLYRTRTGHGLKESKDAVEAWMQARLGTKDNYTPLVDPPSDW